MFLLPIIFISICIIVKVYSTLTIVWCKSQTCLVGKTAIITGANTGIGCCTALDFAKRGARVILACRNEYKANEAREKIINETGNKNVFVKLIDLSSFASVRAFARDIYETEDRLDILVNNAAVLEVGLDTVTVDGHLLLMQAFVVFSIPDLMRGSEPSRIINLMSVMAKFAYNFDVDRIDRIPGTLNDYSISKLCIVLWTMELSKRLKEMGITAYSADPGLVDTDIFKQTPTCLEIIAKSFKRFFFMTPEEGAQTTIHCSVAKDIEKFNGQCFANCQLVADYSTTSNRQQSVNLWNLTKEITNMRQ